MLFIYLILLTILLLVSDNPYSAKYYVPIKMVCSMWFLVMGFSYFGGERLRGYSLVLMIALIFCASGDLYMGFYNQKHKKRDLIVGMGLFMAGHVAFLAALYVKNPMLTPIQVLLPALIAAGFILVYKKARLHMGRLAYAGWVYSLFVSAMMAKALTTGGAIAVAGVLFFVSDFLIIFLYFYHFKTRVGKKIIHCANLLTYYIAIYLFCVSGNTSSVLPLYGI